MLSKLSLRSVGALCCLMASAALGGAPGTQPTAEPASATSPLPVAQSATPEPDVPRSSALEDLAPFSIDYEVRFSGLKGIASLALREANAPDEYLYEVASEAKGLARLLQSGQATETSRFVITEDGLKPLRYDYDGGSGKPDDQSRVSFDWSRLSADSMHEGEPATLELQSNVRDRLSADLQTIIELRDGARPQAQTIAYRNSVRRYDLYPEGEENVATPAGTFSAVKYRRQREGSKRATMIWFAIDADYLPVRIEQMKNGKTSVTMTAVDIDRQ